MRLANTADPKQENYFSSMRAISRPDLPTLRFDQPDAAKNFHDDQTLSAHVSTKIRQRRLLTWLSFWVDTNSLSCR